MPNGVNELTIDAYGASGGDVPYYYNNYDTFYGGYGGYISTDISVTPGQIIYIVIGGQGSSSGGGGYNGGGNGYTYCCTYGGGGGGATDVRDLYSRLVVAGGGGGASSYYGQGYAGGDIYSTASGILTYGQSSYCWSSGGGGGGYYGGYASCGGGGGGTSYTSGTLRTYSVGANYGNGRLVVSYIPPPTSSPTPAPTTYDYYVMQGIIPTLSYRKKDHSAEYSQT